MSHLRQEAQSDRRHHQVAGIVALSAAVVRQLHLRPVLWILVALLLPRTTVVSVEISRRAGDTLGSADRHGEEDTMRLIVLCLIPMIQRRWPVLKKDFCSGIREAGFPHVNHRLWVVRGEFPPVFTHSRAVGRNYQPRFGLRHSLA